MHKLKKRFMFDGDGSLIMHMGSMAVNGQYVAKKFKHIVLITNNTSVGGQKTPTENINFKMLSKGCGYKNIFSQRTLKALKKNLKNFILAWPFFLKYCGPGTFENLIRPNDLKKIVKDFSKYF